MNEHSSNSWCCHFTVQTENEGLSIRKSYLNPLKSRQSQLAWADGAKMPLSSAQRAITRKKQGRLSCSSPLSLARKHFHPQLVSSQNHSQHTRAFRWKRVGSWLLCCMAGCWCVVLICNHLRAAYFHTWFHSLNYCSVKYCKTYKGQGEKRLLWTSFLQRS